MKPLMTIEPHEIRVGDLVDGYTDISDDDPGAVAGYHGKLDIRPKFQRAFIYGDKEQCAVIETLMQGFPLNVMYWADIGGGRYEVIDGQQRIVSICKYHASKFSVGGGASPKLFYNLGKAEQNRFLDYKLSVYFCKGDEQQKLKWFETINIAGKVLEKQELLNATYSGPWLTHAKRYFSKPGDGADNMGGRYIKGATNRQFLLAAALDWISGGKAADYMSAHQKDATADELREHFELVIRWVKKTFPDFCKEMCGLPWGRLYLEHKDDDIDLAELAKRVQDLMEDGEIKRKPGIYEYVLTGEEKHLNLRAFTPAQKRVAYEKQGRKCAYHKKCGCENAPLEEMHADHEKPWSKGGKTEQSNCQVLCARCNREKSGM